MDVAGASRTLADLDDKASRWASALGALDVAPGECVATLLSTSIAGVEAWFGINYAGAVDVSVHTDYQGAMLTHVLATCGCRVLVVDEELTPRLVGLQWGELDRLEHIIVLGRSVDLDAIRSEVAGTVHVHDSGVVSAASTGQGPAARSAGDEASILFTSGTTGRPKGVLVTYTQLIATTDGCWPLDEFGPDDVYYAPVPLHHISGKLAVLTALLTGGRVLLRPQFKTGQFFEDVRAHNVSAVCLVGAMAAFLMAQEPHANDPETTLDKVLLLPLPPYLKAFQDRFGVKVCTIYNQTETSVPIHSNGWVRDRHEGCGTVRDGYECRIVDADDHPVPVGEVGELVVRATEPWAMMRGYLGLPDKTVEAWRNLWYHTGDAFRMDESGCLFFVDRMNDVIRRRGENISSYELESAVARHPAVSECAAIPIRSEWTEDEVKVVLVTLPGTELEPEELLDFLRMQVPRFMLPRFVSFVDELPKTPTQRVRKIDLIERHNLDPVWDREAVGNDRR